LILNYDIIKIFDILSLVYPQQKYGFTFILSGIELSTILLICADRHYKALKNEKVK